MCRVMEDVFKPKETLMVGGWVVAQIPLANQRGVVAVLEEDLREQWRARQRALRF